MSEQSPSEIKTQATEWIGQSSQPEKTSDRRRDIPQTIEILDVGGEGRYETAWNLNIRSRKTLGSHKGEPIPNWLEGRSTAIPLLDSSVQRVIMEQVPLNRRAVREIYRVVVEGGMIELRHFYNSQSHPHAWACRVIRGVCSHASIPWGNQELEETIFRSVQKPVNMNLLDSEGNYL
ncbi:MAG: hypothetical protein P8J33_07965 [Pirellulaceae bacterium]|nr:hypothetical protein [Pirellulaceae bacterium]